MRRPGAPTKPRGQTTRTIRNLAANSYPLVDRGNQTYHAPDYVELAALAMGRRQSLALTSQTQPSLPDSDTFHHHLHDVDPTHVYDRFQLRAYPKT